MTHPRDAHVPWPLLAALGLLAFGAALPAAAVDTSAWACKACPFEKNGVSGSVEAGIGVVSDDSARFGDYTGLNQRGALLTLSGQARWRAENGYWGRLDLSSEDQRVTSEVGLEGRGSLRLGWSEIDHHVSDTGMTPFRGVGSSTLTLPAGYPASATTTMPLATTLQPVDLSTGRQRWEAGLRWTPTDRWTLRLDARHDVKGGTQRLAASFFATSAQLPAQVDQTHDQVEIQAAYATALWQASLGYSVALFHNHADTLTWTNPFNPVVPGATVGQMALAPDNQFHQATGTAAWQVMPWLRVSGDLAIGRMTQDQAFVAITTNASLASPTVLALPARSLDGKVDTWNGNLRAQATLAPRWIVNAGYTRDVHDNRLAMQSWPAVSTDIFVDTSAVRRNLPYDITRDKYKLDTNWRGASGGPLGGLSVAAGAEQDNRQRSYQERVWTREGTVWGRLGMQWKAGISTSLKLSHAERNGSYYGIATYVDPAENPLLRKLNLADRKRDRAALRADWTVNEQLSLGVSADWTRDDYQRTTIGLTGGQSHSVGGDVSYALTDDTQLRAYAQSEWMRSDQAGSQSYGYADWWARNEDKAQVLGLGLKHAAMKGQLELAADYTASRSRSDVSITTIVANPAFPSASTALDSFKLQATWNIDKTFSVTGAFWHERWVAEDWQRDGVAPSAVYNLLTLGDLVPQYRVNVVKVGLRYRF